MRLLAIQIQGKVQLEHLATACLRLTPTVALRLPHTLFLEVASGKRLMSDQQLTLKVTALLRRFGVAGQMVFADSPAQALQLLQFASNEWQRLPVAALATYIAVFTADQERSSALIKMLTLLQKLGVRSLADFDRLPATELLSHFGAMALELKEVMHQPNRNPWPKFVLPTTVIEKLDFAEGDFIEQQEPLLFVLRPLVDRAMARLHGMGGKASEIAITLITLAHSRTSHQVRQLFIALHRPQGAAFGVMPIIRDRLQHELQVRPLQTAVVGVRFTVRRWLQGRDLQHDFFRRQLEEQEKWNALLERVWQKLGGDKFFMAAPVARHLPEKSWQKKFSGLHEANPVVFAHAHPHRPLRLLKDPEPLERQASWLLAPGRKWQVRFWEGPERVSGEWWGEGFARDYFLVETLSGERLWLFVNAKRQLFLHGLSD